MKKNIHRKINKNIPWEIKLCMFDEKEKIINCHSYYLCFYFNKILALKLKIKMCSVLGLKIIKHVIKVRGNLNFFIWKKKNSVYMHVGLLNNLIISFSHLDIVYFGFFRIFIKFKNHSVGNRFLLDSKPFNLKQIYSKLVLKNI